MLLVTMGKKCVNVRLIITWYSEEKNPDSWKVSTNPDPGSPKITDPYPEHWCWQHVLAAPLMAVLSWQFCPDSPFQAVLASCSACSVLPVLFWLSCNSCFVIAVPSFLFCPCCLILAVQCWQVTTLSWQPCLGSPVEAVLSSKFYHGSLVLLVLFSLSYSSCTVLAVSCPDCPFLVSSPFCLALAVFLKQSCQPGSPVLAALSGQSFLGSPVLAELFFQFCSACPVLPVLSLCPVLPVTFWLSRAGCPVLAVHCPFLAFLSFLSSGGCLVLAVLSLQPCPCSPVRADLS